MGTLRDDFILQQFITLREEIRETKDRTFKISAIALFVFPAGEHIARAFEAKLLLLILPVLVISVALLYLAENHALMRCGRYLRLNIEPEIPQIVGWERWLETQDACEPRSVDRYVSYSTYSILAVYYLVSVGVASNQFIETYGVIPGAVVLTIYGGIGFIAVTYLVHKVRSTTTTAADSLSAAGKP